MRFVCPTLVVICSLAAAQTFAEEAKPQPLTRAGCEEAGLTWNDNAHVCYPVVNQANTEPEVTWGGTCQPLTRSGCDLAGMQWNDFANVCDVEFEEEAEQTYTKTIASPTSTILINIDKASQKMTVSVDGQNRYHWPVSTGRAGYSTPSGTFTAKSMNKIWYSREWDNAPMPHAIFFTKNGHAIHGTDEVKKLGKPASHGCVRLSPQNASTLFTLVADNGLENTQVVLAGRTPGRSVEMSSPSKSRAKKSRSTASKAKAASSSRPRYSLGPSNDKSYARPKKQGGGLFKRLFKRK